LVLRFFLSVPSTIVILVSFYELEHLLLAMRSLTRRCLVVGEVTSEQCSCCCASRRQCPLLG
jgi:hypothetical protein